MKTFLKSFFLFSFLLISCGEDGKEGKAFIKLDWDSSFLSYWDNNPGIPYIFYEHTDYECDAGIYSFQYECDNGSEYRLWQGTYSITKNPGEKGSLLVDGKDGASKFFKLYLRWSGASISSKALFNDDDVSPVLSSTKIITRTPLKENQVKNVYEQVITERNVTITLKYWIVE